MHLASLVVPVFAAAAVAQTTRPTTSFNSNPTRTSSSASTTSTGLVSLVQQLPTCALSCLNSAATAINCNAANFSCLCNNSSGLVANIGLCVISACSSDDTTKLTTLTTEICSVVQNNPDPTQVASASSIVASALGGSGSSTSSSKGLAPRQTDAPMLAVMGGAAAIWAAYAM